MPEHTSFLSYLVAMFPALGENMRNLGHTAFGKPVTVHSAEPLLASFLVCVSLAILAWVTRSKVVDYEKSVIPEAKLTLSTFMEFFVSVFYDATKDVMGAKRAKKYFPVIGTAACFIFFSNAIGLIPGLTPPTSSWNITLGCALVVFVLFNYWGIKENGWGYFKHLAGPVWYLAWLIFPLELLSVLIRPITLSIRLMINMAVDHLLVTIFTGLFMVFLPLPVMLLGTLVIVVQTYVFCLLTAIYITLATDHEEHDAPEHATGASPATAHAAH